MKRKIMEITEIDCGDTLCERCRWKGSGYHVIPYDYPAQKDNRCEKFFKKLIDNTQSQWLRLPECLEAERLMKQADDCVALANIRAGRFTVIEEPSSQK
jgi:hypothetical protein